MILNQSRWGALVIGLLIGLVGCQTGGGRTLYGAPCSEIERQIDLSERIDTLNRLADAFTAQCYDTVIVHGEKARSEFRHKTFSLLKETTNVFIPEGSFIDYVLESYERGYLSLLLGRAMRMYRNWRRQRSNSGSWITSCLHRSTITAKTPSISCCPLCYGNEWGR